MRRSATMLHPPAFSMQSCRLTLSQAESTRRLVHLSTKQQGKHAMLHATEHYAPPVALAPG